MTLNDNNKKPSKGDKFETLADEIELNEGDTIGIAYDHVTLQFYLNGITIGNGEFFFYGLKWDLKLVTTFFQKKNILSISGITGIKGKVYPVVFVDESAILDVEFINFEKRPPSGFGQIMFEQNIL